MNGLRTYNAMNMFVEVGERNKGDFVKYKKFSTSASMDAYCIETKTTALLLFDAELLRSHFLASPSHEHACFGFGFGGEGFFLIGPRQPFAFASREC